MARAVPFDAAVARDLRAVQPPVPEARLPDELVTRFAGPPHDALVRLLVWLSPATVGRGQPTAITLHEGA